MAEQETEFAAQLEKMKAEIETAKTEAQAAKVDAAQYKQNMQKMNRRYEELAAQRTQEPQDYGEEAPTQPNGSDNEWMAQRLQKMELANFKASVGKDEWGAVSAIINDPDQAPEVVVYDQFGKVDNTASLHRALDKVKLAGYEAAKLEAEGVKAESAVAVEAQKLQGTISGQTASEETEEVDTSKMTSDEMIKAGLVEMDPHDPVQIRHSSEE